MLEVYQNVLQIISFAITDGYFFKTLSFKAFFIFSLVCTLAKSEHAQMWTPELNYWLGPTSENISLSALNNL